MSSDATAVAPRKQPSRKANRWTGMALFFVGLGILVLLVVAFFAFWIVGLTHGREFDAGSWTFRNFTFVRNPLTDKQFSSIYRTTDFSVPTSILPLIAGGPLSPGTRWDLVEISKGTFRSSGEAQVLLDYLSALDQQNNYYWENWTSKHPKAAPILWAAVRDCVHLQRYDRLPEIFESARSTTKPDKLSAKLKQIMLDIAGDEAKLQTALGNDQARQRAEKLAAAYRLPPAGSSPAANSPADKPQAEVEQIP